MNLHSEGEWAREFTMQKNTEAHQNLSFTLHFDIKKDWKTRSKCGRFASHTFDNETVFSWENGDPQFNLIPQSRTFKISSGYREQLAFVKKQQWVTFEKKTIIYFRASKTVAVISQENMRPNVFAPFRSISSNETEFTSISSNYETHFKK